MASDTAYAIPANFTWQPEYDTLLEQIAANDRVEQSVEWTELRNVIKYKIEQNIIMFLNEPTPPRKPRVFTEQLLVNGGLRLPPFPPRRRDDPNVNEVPIVYMTAEQASALKASIFAQLHDFDDGPPFTIQRLCELCLRPKEHYKAVGKYLRAVEKSILVTSMQFAFPPLPPPTELTIQSLSRPYSSTAPSTPFFSPIPFLHEDARRSKSRSPPPSPLTLNSVPDSQKVLGLVDELDDPRPGHLSDNVTPLTATTTPPTPRPQQPTSRPFLATLRDRFVRSGGGEVSGDAGVGGGAGGLGTEFIDDDPDGDKENKA